MDKNTLSNYGWIVICTLVLAVMLALATPFGEFISGAFRSTFEGFGNVTDNALAVIEIGNSGNGGSGEQGGTGDENQDGTQDCSHAESSLVSNENGTHSAVCDDCKEKLVNTTANCKDLNSDGKCDDCKGTDITYELVIYNVENVLYFNQIEGATRYEIYSASNIGTPIDYFSSCGFGDYESMNAFDLLRTSSPGTYEFVVFAVDTTNGRNVLAVSNRLVVTLVE